MKFFTGFSKTVEAVKRRYKELARENHPDLGGDTATMQAINAEYLRILSALDGQESNAPDGKVHTYKYREETEQAIIDKIDEIISKVKGDAEVWLIGFWVWILKTSKGDGNGDVLKAAGFKWMQHRKAWAWKPYKGKTRRSAFGLDVIAARYGANMVREESKGSDSSSFAGQLK